MNVATKVSQRVRFTVFLGLVYAAAAYTIVYAWVTHPPTLSDAGLMATLTIITLIVAWMPIQVARGSQDLAAGPVIAAMLLLPPGAVAVVATVGTINRRRPGRDGYQWRAWFFNRAILCLAATLPTLLVSQPLSNSADLASWLGHLGVFVPLPLVINVGLTAAYFSFRYGVDYRKILWENVTWTTIRSFLFLGLAGGLLGSVLLHRYGYFFSAILVLLLYAVRQNIKDALLHREERSAALLLAAQTLDARDRYTERHSQNVADLAEALAEKLDLSFGTVEQIRASALLHDIGKIGIRDHILLKNGPLTEHEWEVMKQHPVIGEEMLRRHRSFTAHAILVRHHHERWDGSGYPDGLAGEQIPMGSRIISVADSFDTITTQRHYRRDAVSPEQAAADIVAKAGRWYDPAIALALASLVSYGNPATLRPTVATVAAETSADVSAATG